MASPEEKDYSVIGEFTPESAYGVCVCCNHCQPCPKSLNVGLLAHLTEVLYLEDAVATFSSFTEESRTIRF